MKTAIRKVLLPALAGLALFTASRTWANNIQVTNPTLINGTEGNATIQFDLSWENSWRGGDVGNWDAAWVFVKYYRGGAWHHVNLNNSGHISASGSQIDVGLLSPDAAYDASSNPAVGVFVYRDADGNGSLSLPSTQLSWNYAVQGTTFNDISQIQVFAIEMVYVPQGTFAAGSGGSESNAFALTTINTGDATTTPSGTGSLGGAAGGYPTGQTAPSSAYWPNGYNAFYSMKYEVSQQGYVDFLNTLQRVQQITRVSSDISGTSISNRYVMPNQPSMQDRNGIRCDATLPVGSAPVNFYCDLNGNGIGGEVDDGKDVACNYLNWGDLTAYLDWSGLRPMTEMEFEKACRGTVPPVPNEYPWGNVGSAVGIYGLANAGANNESITTNYSTTLGNAAYNQTAGISLNGPLRVGIFAANGSNSGRVSAGAGYYGIMELGGNLSERAVTIGNANGRAFTGTHGNGELAANGNPDASSWPAPTTADGCCQRGGDYRHDFTFLRVSERFNANFLHFRDYTRGGRGNRLP